MATVLKVKITVAKEASPGRHTSDLDDITVTVVKGSSPGRHVADLDGSSATPVREASPERLEDPDVVAHVPDDLLGFEVVDDIPQVAVYKNGHGICHKVGCCKVKSAPDLMSKDRALATGLRPCLRCRP